MKRIKVLAAAALLALAPSLASAQPGKGEYRDPWTMAEPGLDADFLIGRWTDDENCDHAVEFLADGSFAAANGTSGYWDLEGDALTLTGTYTMTLRIVPLDADTINVVNPDGSLGRSTRCGAAGPPLPPLDETV